MASGLVIVATPGESTANSYVTLTDADAILLGYTTAVTSAWDAATDAQCNAALVQATREIDSERLRGTKYNAEDDEEDTDTFQALHFPIAENYSDSDGACYIPESVEKATAVQAAYLLRFGADAVAMQDMINAGVRVNEPGHLRQTYSAGGSVLCQEAKRLISAYIIAGIKVRRG
jgi:hypothetical protein